METVFEHLEKKQLHTPRGNVVYWVRQENSPVTLVFLHGLLCDHRIFSKQLSPFLGRYNLLCWDSPVHGRSRPYSVHTYGYAARDLHEILETEALSGPVLIGHCLGGVIAQVYLRYYPALGFVGLDTLPCGKQYISRGEQRLLWQIQWLYAPLSRKQLVKILLKHCCGAPESRLRLAEILELYSKRDILRLLTLGTAGFLKENRDQTLPCPVLLLTGQQDQIAHLVQHDQDWARNTGAPLHWIPSAGHLACLENPEAVNREIETFLEKLVPETQETFPCIKKTV